MDNVKGLCTKALGYAQDGCYMSPDAAAVVAALVNAAESLSRELAEARAERDGRVSFKEFQERTELGAAWQARALAAEAASASKDERIRELEAEVARVRSDREYIVGFNAGWDEAAEQTLRFPTMLRKMWSGGEVQQWIDKQMAELRARALTKEQTDV